MTDETLTTIEIGDHGSTVALAHVARFNGERHVSLTIVERYSAIETGNVRVEAEEQSASVDMTEALKRAGQERGR
jgi:hypothetical protein